MTDKIFREGGPHQIKQTGSNEYKMNVSIPKNEAGRIARECPSDSCSPGYFKIKPGTGITDSQESAFCPYCRHSAKPGDFTTKEQIRYAKDLVSREAIDGIDRMIKGALGIGPSGRKRMGGDFFSIGMNYKSSQKPHVRRPFEEEVRRDIICQYCGLDHSVYGLATWCADCGKDIFLTHVDTELSVVRLMLSDIERRRKSFGARIAAKDLENCLEDTVSIFEAVLKIIVRRCLNARGMSIVDIDKILNNYGNAFQNVNRAEAIFVKDIQISLFEGRTDVEISALEGTFTKRHPITHNLGIVDKKYIERSRRTEGEGREVLVTGDEIEKAIMFSLETFKSVHERLFGQE